jgi:hypothetical protein
MAGDDFGIITGQHKPLFYGSHYTANIAAACQFGTFLNIPSEESKGN